EATEFWKTKKDGFQYVTVSFCNDPLRQCVEVELTSTCRKLGKLACTRRTDYQSFITDCYCCSIIRVGCASPPVHPLQSIRQNHLLSFRSHNHNREFWGLRTRFLPLSIISYFPLIVFCISHTADSILPFLEYKFSISS